MKATVNNSANFVINNDMLNETKCLKYVSKPTMLEEIVNIQVALAKLNSNYTPRQYTEKNSKQELFEGYGRLVTIYKELSEKRETEIAKNVATCIKTADVLAEETRVKAEADSFNDICEFNDMILEVQGYLASYDVTPFIHLQS